MDNNVKNKCNEISKDLWQIPTSLPSINKQNLQQQLLKHHELSIKEQLLKIQLKKIQNLQKINKIKQEYKQQQQISSVKHNDNELMGILSNSDDDTTTSSYTLSKSPSNVENKSNESSSSFENIITSNNKILKPKEHNMFSFIYIYISNNQIKM